MNTSKKDEIKSFVLYQSYETQFKMLSMQKRGELITAVFEYVRTGVVPSGLSKLVALPFSCIKEALDRDRLAYVEKCERNAANGRLGGRPKKDSSVSKTERFFEKPKKAYNDNDNENDNDNVFVYDERSSAPLKNDARVVRGDPAAGGVTEQKKKKGELVGQGGRQLLL